MDRENIGRNVVASIKGDKLTLVINLTADTKPSVSGKSNVLATTNGNVVVDIEGAPAGLKLGVNVFRPLRA